MPDFAAAVADSLSPDARAERFRRIAEEAISERHIRGSNGFGTLREKRLHAAVKRYLCEDARFHEVKVAGTRYLADVCIGQSLFEVQTGNLYPLFRKIAAYLEDPDRTVTVVRPLAVNRTLCWIDPENGTVTPPRKVGYHSRPAQLLSDLYPLRTLLRNPRLRVRLLLLEVVDFRLLNGWSGDRKRGAERYERVPTGLIDDRTFSRPDEYLDLFPDGLPERFPVRSFSGAIRLPRRDADRAVRTLEALGLVCPTGKEGRATLWSRTGTPTTMS